MMENLAYKVNLNYRVPSFYKYIHKRIVERDGKNISCVPINTNMIQRKTICLFLNSCNVKKELINTFLKEMEEYGLIKIVSKKRIEIIIQ